MSITLYGEKYWFSPYFYSVHIALKEKELPFETKILSLGDDEHKKGVIDGAITGRVPAMEHDGFWLAESSAMIEYLEDVFPKTKRVLPTDAKQRARARQIMAWVRSDLMPIREERSTATIFYADARSGKPLSEKGREAAQKLLRVANALVRDANAPMFDTWSIADADLALMLQRLIKSGDDVPPKIRDWANAQWSRPSVREFVEHSRPPKYDPYY